MRQQQKSKWAAALLAAAGFSAWAGTPAARGDIIISTFNMGVQNYGGNNWQVWVLGATNNGLNGTSTGIDAVDVTIQTLGTPLGIDIEKLNGAGANSIYNVNVDGQTPDAGGIDAGGPPDFGDVVGGSFVGVGTGVFTTNLVNNPINTTAGSMATVSANGHSAVTSGKVTQIDPAFKNPVGPPINAGNIDNGTVDSLEVTSAVPADPGTNASTGPVPFANIVLPLNTYISVHGTIGPSNGGGGPIPFALSLGEPPPPFFLLSGAPQSGTTNVGTVTMIGSHGGYTPQTVSGITLPGSSAGNLQINGFNPPNDNQLFGLQVSGENSLAQFISDLNNLVQLSNPGAVAELPTGPAGAIFTALGENVEVVFPGSATPDASPEYLSYSLAGFVGDGSVTINEITVLPEPAALGILAIGGIGLLRRKRRRGPHAMATA
jgi:hypothetical protein